MLAQVRLHANEAAALRETMRILGLSSTSDTLREALRLLHKEAVETAAAERIRAFYGGEQAPLPEGAAWEASPEELAAADEMTW